MVDEKIKVYGTTWCGDCHMARHVLDRLGVPYEWIDLADDEQALRYIEHINNCMKSVPTIVFQDGSILVEPSPGELTDKLRSLTRV